MEAEEEKEQEQDKEGEDEGRINKTRTEARVYMDEPRMRYSREKANSEAHTTVALQTSP